MVPIVDGAALIDGQRWVRCTQYRPLGCNWLAPDEQTPYERGRCLADSLIRREPAADDTLAREKLVPTAAALRRLVYQLDDIGLPIDPFWRHDGGLAFDLLSSRTTGEKVIIGHANGVITIDVVESLDDYRESLRVKLGEPYRTMLGHFRHEVGHYYQNVLVETGSGAAKYLDQCRALFGDERASYSDAIARHYKSGAPAGWEDRSSPSTPRCTRGRTSPSASPTTCTSPTPSTPAARRAWCCWPSGFGSPRRATSCRSILRRRPVERLLSTGTGCRCCFNRVQHGDGQESPVPVRHSPGRCRQARLRPQGRSVSS